MAFAGLIFIGLLFGVMLSAIVAAFIVVRSGGQLKEALFARSPRKPAFAGPVTGLELSPEADKRHRALLEELRVSQKLLDQGRVEREEFARQTKAVQDEMQALRGQIADRDQRIQSLEASLSEAMLRSEGLLGQLGDRTEELSRVSGQLKDARMELEMTESGSSVTTAQIGQLQRERDELAALVERLQPSRSASRPFA